MKEAAGLLDSLAGIRIYPHCSAGHSAGWRGSRASGRSREPTIATASRVAWL